MEVPPSGPPTLEKKVEDPVVVITPKEDYEDNLAEKISKKVLERLGINSNNTLKSVISEAFNGCVPSNDKNEEDPACKWLDSEDHLTCDICLHLSTMEIPNHLKILKRRNFGVSKNASKYNLKRSIRVHVNSPLQIWCENRLKEMSEAQAEKNRINLEAATLLATNAALCFETFGSAKDFVRLRKDITIGTSAITELVVDSYFRPSAISRKENDMGTNCIVDTVTSTTTKLVVPPPL